MQFEHQDSGQAEELQKRSISYGFSALLESVTNGKRSHVGYTKLEPEEPRIKRDKVHKERKFRILVNLKWILVLDYFRSPFSIDLDQEALCSTSLPFRRPQRPDTTRI